ncbi:hypothetical protein KEJ45_07065 [Candidatus Bathyarchaeota archaeon]|nr:hypothetical protein [Candidatus Bathyarchaeota archaeon]
MVKEEFKAPIDVMGISTGGTIAQYFALNNPQLVSRLVLAMTGYCLSDDGKKLQRQVGEFARLGKWTAAYSTMMKGVYPKNGLRKNLN